MLTLFHSPESRSVAILSLIEEMGIQDWVTVRTVTIPRMDGSGGRDPANPHPEGKVPALVHDGVVLTERAAIILHLTSLFPDSGLAPKVGTPEWGAFATWMAWYQGVLEPAFILEGAGVSHPWLTAAIRDHKTAVARLRAALETGPWIMGAKFTAADILLHGPYAWFPEGTPDDPLIRDWVDRCKAREASRNVRAEDARRMATLHTAA
ncbi:glutathione S-transferase family protein [Tabrizicola sp.]|uniref:glutathione S-transferase family protein n=1 Tax=Tabrizicola sp. TaxID=2005166 RepID=UPI00273445C7|nr:glutathione S-transferase family protein [Tabrizicola sp.]MDP3193919.1 glutathione S-transferase family protein [Tabrizicola sp.]